MALVADTQHAVELLQGMQSELQEKGDLELDQDLGDMIAMMESPLFTQLLTLQQSMRQLRDHVESTPPGEPIGEFDFTPSGELILQEPPRPEPEPEPEPKPSHPYAYENKIDLEDEVVEKAQAATVEQSAPPTDMDEVDALLDSIAELAMGRDVHTVKLMKPENGGLGFSVVGLRSENHGELGIFVQQIQPNGVADKNGNLQESDQILAINGHLLDASVSHQEAIVMLQKVKGLVELVVARGVFQIPVNAQAKDSAPEPNETPADTVLEPFQIELYNDGSGLGFGIVGVQDVGIMVKTILTGGTADRDGRLQSGDIILQIGDTPLHGMTSDQVAMVLRQAGSHVRLTVARRVVPDQQGPAQDGQPTVQQEPTIQAVEIPQEHSQSPPQYNEEEVKDMKIFDVVLEKGAEGLGITIAGYVRDLGTGQVSGIFIKKIAEGSAADRNGMVQVNDQIIEVDGQGLEGFNNVEAVDLLRNTGSTVHIKLARHPPGTLDISNIAMDQPDFAAAPVHEALVESQEVDNEEEAPPVTPPSYPPPAGVLSVAQSDTITPNDFEGELDPEVEASLVEAWQSILGTDVIIVVAQLSKFREGGGLGISLEGTVDIDEAGEEVRPHHYIRSILQDGPVGQNGRLQSGDELLEVNGERLLGLNHVDVVKTLKELPVHVRIVCARHPHPVFPEVETPGESTLQPMAAPEASPVFDAAASAEAKEEVLTPQQILLQESVPFPEVVEAGTLMSTPVVAERTSSQVPRDSISGLAIWDDQLLTVELVKGDRGLGFSILDYQDPLNPSKTVIVIRSLVSGGVAEQDGRLIPGDRLVFVNDCNLDDCSLEMAVQALKGAPQGKVVLKVAKPLPQLAEDTFDGPEPEIMPQHVASVHQAPPSGFQDVSAHAEELQELQEMQLAMEASQTMTPSPETVRRSPLVEEMVLSAVVSSSVESSIDFSQLMNDEPETPPAEVEATPPVKEIPAPVTETTQIEAETTPPVKETLPPATETTSIEAATTPLPAETTPTTVDTTPLEPKTTQPVAKTTPPDLVMAATVAPIPAQQTQPVTPTQVTADKTAPPEPKRQPPAPPPKPSPRTSTGAVSSQPTSPSEPTDSRVPLLAASHSPLGKRVSVVLPSFLERSIILKKGNAGLGLTVNADKANGVVVKSIIRGGAVHHDGRLAVGDYITSVNGQPVRNLTNVEARALLRRASLVGDEISMTYIPASEASAYRENPDSYSPKLPAASTASASPLRASQEAEDDKFALPLKDQPVDTVKEASVALSPVAPPSAKGGPEEIRTVRLNKEPNKSLGISIVGGRASDGQPVEGIYIKHVLDDSQAGRTGALKTGDRILEVNGCDLRDASHDYAVAIIRNAANPVCFIVQSLSAGDNIPTGVVSVIPISEEDAVATAMEKTEALPVSVEKEKKYEERSKVNNDTMMAPLSPLKHKLSLSGSEDEVDGTKEGNSTGVMADFANLDGDIFTVHLTKSSLGLGISLAGNRDRSKKSVFVVGVDPGGAAGQDGRLQVADELLSINGVSVYGKSHQRASALIKDIPKEGDVHLIVRRHPLALKQLAVTPLTPANPDKNQHFEFTQPDRQSMENVIASYPNVHTVTINKGGKGLGFAIQEREDMKGRFGIFIRDITKGGAADTEGSLQTGDHILSVDGNSLINTKKNEAILVLKGTDGKVSLMVSSEHPFTPSKPVPEQEMPKEVQQKEPVQEVVAAAVVSEEQHSAAPPAMDDETSAKTRDDAEVGIKEEAGRSEDVERDDTGKNKTQENADRETGENKITETEEACQERDEQGVTEEKVKAIGEDKEKVMEVISKDSEQIQEEVNIQPEVADTQEQEPVVEEGKPEKLETPEPPETQSTPVTAAAPETTPAPATAPKPEAITTPAPATPAQTTESTPIPAPTQEPATTDVPDPYTCPILPGVQTDIIIDKGKTGLGLSIVGGTDTQLSIVVVHEVYDHGAAARDNRLWPGDQLIQVNGIDLTNVRHEQAIAALRQSPTYVRLRVFRGQQQVGQGEPEEDVKEKAGGEVADAPREEEGRPDEDEYDEMLSVELKHTRGRSLGLNIVGKTSGKGVVVSMVIRGSAAHAEGTLRAGDHILSVNGKDVQEATREEVAALLKATEGHVLFEIGRKKDLGKTSQKEEKSHKQVRLVELKKIPGESLGLSIAGGKGSEMGDIPLIIASINPGSQADKNKQLKVLDCIESINSHSVAGLSYANAINLLKSSQGVIRLEVTELSPKIKDWYLSSQKPGIKGDSMVAVKASVKQPTTAGSGEDASAGRLKNIELQRGPDGLGFSIVGGHGSPHGDLPIYIKTVFNKGAASVSGELKRGDQILAVNGHSLESATHEQAVDILKQAKGRVVITILA